ncbi:MAG: phosphoribosylaminoimidazolecarboxamide formyltransferase/IMP cyclohydrolase [Thermomicrobiales bacterium]|jgi:phosphoribosylaminoimidazolecarboxamide formyltransferase/IMP cyclohydrolase|nr:phosphoribosylaminoimidazolecarboxamide formyltransferase/IMP cyclohydrolase [Thermomicrobiales bacterium]
MRALLSVYDKTGIAALGRGLVDLGYEVVSTGGTLAALEAAGLLVTAVSEITTFPEILDGRVKTLHPHIHGGLLARRDDPAHLSELAAHQISPIDVVAANLYPFAATVARPGVSLADALEQIDIGGPAMIRAAAKNFPGVVVLTDPADYTSALDDLRDGRLSAERRRALAAKAFAHTAAYDAVVAEYLRDLVEWPQEVTFAGRLTRTLRYGENPQQRAAAYQRLQAGQPVQGALEAEQLAGKELSFNNLLDADAAWNTVRGLTQPAVAIVKHTIPCGLAERGDLARAFQEALRGDPVSAFGGIVALNRPVDGETARRMAEVFFEVVVAPGFDDESIETLGKRKALRLLRVPTPSASATESPEASWDVRPIAGGLLVQTADCAPADASSWRVVTAREPNAQEMADLAFAWHAVRHVKSNAIVLARDRAVTGVGSGQPNRLESVRIAVDKAGDRAAGSVLASDAFFPFPDGLEAAIAAGVTAAIQPGGSVRDEEVIAAANSAGLAMVFTGTRHFRH